MKLFTAAVLIAFAIAAHAQPSRPYLPSIYDDAGIVAVPASLGKPIFVQVEYLDCLSDPDATWFEDGSAVC